MKDWRKCKKITYTSRKIYVKEVEKTYTMHIPNFRPCFKCTVEECKGKVLINAERKALKALSKY